MSWLRVSAAALLFAVSTAVHVAVLLIAALLKALAPLRPVRRTLDHVLMAIAESWIGCNSRMIRWLTNTRLLVAAPTHGAGPGNRENVGGEATLEPSVPRFPGFPARRQRGEASLRRDGHYLVLANHQSWVDIPVLQAVFNRRIPLLRFFLKSQLFWVPLLGLAWWALDFPFMKRYSRETLARRPELAGRDIAATRRSCAKFRDIPVSVMNFVEGTRFTPAKHAGQASPFAHLLKPRAGGVGFVLDAMGEALHSLLDVTIVYPHGRPTLAGLFADRVPEVRVEVVERPIPAELVGGDYENDPEVRRRVQRWINEIWRQKDASIARMLGPEAQRAAEAPSHVWT